MRNVTVADQPGLKGDPAFLNGWRLFVEVSSFAGWLIMPFQAVVMGGLRTDFSTEYSLNRRLADEFQGAAVLFTARQDLNKVRAPFL